MSHRQPPTALGPQHRLSSAAGERGVGSCALSSTATGAHGDGHQLPVPAQQARTGRGVARSGAGTGSREVGAGCWGGEGAKAGGSDCFPRRRGSLAE